ncbi:type I glyceraldehyde-3-phosphate dehydrogenase [Desulfomonile tiedjei]|uniref:Glyceraldehyde-3-phosphate dehydrogenase n=1 Tax=Desulfomonile tiedjei (strain ATCC 49306 / DSM 6799 / DCB-1) TaxID=706587 RepID=I4BZR6_DESTA|nr:type I glyceraldehyde-3-phosphate dehydrogenase [Desulfomonile tiedjei]AFM22807.1 glyceraldehyde-3-phosphate dehydrogenase (NAD+) [Desulfomonile tiedjei DSM 6799]
MAIRIAINGFGRIGRTVMRSALVHPEIEVVAVNDRMDPDLMAFLLKYDSVHGQFPGEVTPSADVINVSGKEVRALRITDDLLNLPWRDLKVDVVMECTGIFRDREKAGKHIEAGAKKVIVSAPGKKVDATFVIGVNEETYDPTKHHVVSNASCTTNCLAPIAKVLFDEFGIEKGVMTTVHSYTMDQSLLDTVHKDYRRARAAAINMIPTTTGAASAIGQVIPELAGKLDGLAIRVTTPNVSLVDFTALVKKGTTPDEVNAAMKRASEGRMKGILEYVDKPLVSVDFINNTHSSMFDSLSTFVVGDNMVKVLSWYDNESGYSARMVDLAVLMGEKLS